MTEPMGEEGSEKERNSSAPKSLSESLSDRPIPVREPCEDAFTSTAFLAACLMEREGAELDRPLNHSLLNSSIEVGEEGE